MAFFIKQNDTSPSLKAFIQDADGNSVNLTGAAVRLHINETGGGPNIIDELMTVNDANGGEVQYDWVAADTVNAGTFSAEIEITFSDGKIETFPNDGYFTITITAELN